MYNTKFVQTLAFTYRNCPLSLETTKHMKTYINSLLWSGILLLGVRHIKDTAHEASLLLLKTVTFRLTVLWLWIAGRSSCCRSELTRLRSLLIDWSIVQHCELELATSDLIRTCVLVSQRATFSMNSRSAASDLNLSWSTSKRSVDRSQYDTRCYFNVCSKADISQLNISPILPHGNDN